MNGRVVLFNSLSEGGDFIQQVLEGDDGFLDHVYLLDQSFSL